MRIHIHIQISQQQQHHHRHHHQKQDSYSPFSDSVIELPNSSSSHPSVSFFHVSTPPRFWLSGPPYSLNPILVATGPSVLGKL
jgi:hypothetical protein